MTGGPPVNGAAALSAGLARSIVLRHVRCHRSGAQLRHMIGRVVGFVFAYGDPATGEPASDCQHRLGGTPLGGAGGFAEDARHRQSVTILHSDVPHVAQLRLAARRLAIQPAVRIGGALVGVVLAGLAVEVRAIPIAAVLRAEAPLRRPGFDQRPVHRSVRPTAAASPADDGAAAS